MRAYGPTWGDVQTRLESVFTPDERCSILDANRRWAAEGGVGTAQTAWPAVDPGWNHNVDADYRQLQLAREGLEEAIRLAGQKTASKGVSATGRGTPLGFLC